MNEDSSLIPEALKNGIHAPVPTAPEPPVESHFLAQGETGSQDDSTYAKCKSIRIGRDGRTYISAQELGLYFKSESVDHIVTPSNQILAFKITTYLQDGSFSSYHLYRGGREFRPVLSRNRLSPGQQARISLELLPLKSFIAGIPSFELANLDFTRWVADRVVAKSVSAHDDGELQIEFVQDHPLVDVADFVVRGSVDRYPGPSNQNKGVYLQFSLVDYIGRKWKLRIRHDGLKLPQFQIDRGAGCESVNLISFDGFRLTFRYGRQGAMSTCYIRPPSEEVYGIGQTRNYSGRYLNLVQGVYSKALIIDDIKVKRTLERTMLKMGSIYDQGRIGSEIAYLCGVKCLGLRNLVIEEPSKGGKESIHARQ